MVEREDGLYLLKVKAANQVDTGEVQYKEKAAADYCKYASEYNAEHGKQPWKYVLLPHNKIMANSSFDKLLNNAE